MKRNAEEHLILTLTISISGEEVFAKLNFTINYSCQPSRTNYSEIPQTFKTGQAFANSNLVYKY